MSYFIDVQYLNKISHKLPLFKKQKNNLWNCRCLICGDSSTNKNKARGFFYQKHNRLLYKCHNCAVGETFGKFLERLDTNLYNQYLMEKFEDIRPLNRNTRNDEEELELEFSEPKFSVLSKICARVDKLPADHEVVKYCVNRKIPEEKYKQLYFLAKTRDIQRITDEYDEVNGVEPRLLLPFYNEKEELVGMTLRGIRGEKLRYISIKLDSTENLFFGLLGIDKTRTVYVTEGPIDSLFLDNAIACGGVAFNKLQTIEGLCKDNVVLVFDNQPRNREIVKFYEKFITQKYKICIWPEHIVEKDINEMVLAGLDVKRIIDENTFSDLQAELQFTTWRKV